MAGLEFAPGRLPSKWKASLSPVLGDLGPGPPQEPVEVVGGFDVAGV